MLEVVTRARQIVDDVMSEARRRARDETGAISIEYVGILFFVVAIVLAILELDLAPQIGQLVSSQVEKVLGYGN